MQIYVANWATQEAYEDIMDGELEIHTLEDLAHPVATLFASRGDAISAMSNEIQEMFNEYLDRDEAEHYFLTAQTITNEDGREVIHFLDDAEVFAALIIEERII